jgi:hypothetical protein
LRLKERLQRPTTARESSEGRRPQLLPPAAA